MYFFSVFSLQNPINSNPHFRIHPFTPFDSHPNKMLLRFNWIASFCLLSSIPTFNLAHRSHGAYGPFGIGPLNGLRQHNPTAYFHSSFCQSGQQKRISSQVLSLAQIDFLCRRFARIGGTFEDGIPLMRESRAGGARMFPKGREFLEFDGWAMDESAVMPRTEKRAYDYIRFGRRSVPIEFMEKKMAADKKANRQNTYDYIRFGRRRR